MALTDGHDGQDELIERLTESFPWPRTQAGINEMMQQFDGETKLLILDMLRVEIKYHLLSEKRRNLLTNPLGEGIAEKPME